MSNNKLKLKAIYTIDMDGEWIISSGVYKYFLSGQWLPGSLPTFTFFKKNIEQNLTTTIIYIDLKKNTGNEEQA